MTTNETVTENTFEVPEGFRLIPAVGKVRGARKLEGTLDLSLYDDDKIWAMLSMVTRLLSTNASASIKDFEKSVQAETKKFDEVLAGKWVPGGRGPRMDDEERALAEIITDLFIGLGIDKKDAAKRAKKADGFTDYLRLAMTKASEDGKTIPSDEAIAEEAKAQEPIIAELVAEAVAVMEENRKREEENAKASKSKTDALLSRLAVQK